MQVLERNDPRQYDGLADQWWDEAGHFAMLHWIAAARAPLIPVARREGAVLVDVACGGGLMAPHVQRAGYRHVGVDIGVEATRTAREHGLVVVRGDALRLPLADACADVVVAGEVLEHVTDLGAAVAEVCRVLRPGGTVVVDAIARTRLATALAVTVAERVPGGPPAGLHDPALFVDRRELVELFAAGGVTLSLRGLRPSLPGMARWLALPSRRVGRPVPMRVGGPTAVLFQGLGIKARSGA